MCVSKAAVRAATEEAAVRCRAAGTRAQFPSDCSKAVLAEVLRRRTSVSTPTNAAEAASSGRLVTKGIPVLRDQRARLPKPAPSRMTTEDLNAAVAGSR